MNSTDPSASAQRPINWRKFMWLGLVLLIVGYTYGRPTLEKWTGLDLPVLDGTEERQPQPEKEFNYDITFGNDKGGGTATLPKETTQPKVTSQPKSDSSGRSTAKAAEPSTPEFELKKIGQNKFMSPAGLIYGMGPRGEHRIDHVMRHGKDDPSRPVHSVFEGDKRQILQTIDDAYGLVKEKSKYVKSSREGNRMEYTISLGKKIGYEGGQSGKRKKYPSLKKLKLILQDKNNVVTAYPYR